MDIKFDNKLVRITPHLHEDTKLLQSSTNGIPQTPNTEIGQFQLEACTAGNNFHLFLTFFSLWMCQENCDSKMFDACRPRQTPKEPDFWIDYADPIAVKYENEDEYYIALNDVKFHQFCDATYDHNTKVCAVKSEELMVDNLGRDRIREDEVYKINFTISHNKINGDGEFQILDERKLTPNIDHGKFNFEITDLKINAEVSISKIDLNFTDEDVKFSAPEIQLQIDYNRFMVNVESYPSKWKPYFYKGHYIKPILTENMKRIVRDFIKEKLERGKEELTDRLRVYIIDKTAPLVMNMSSMLDVTDAFFLAMQIEPRYSLLVDRFNYCSSDWDSCSETNTNSTSATDVYSDTI